MQIKKVQFILFKDYNLGKKTTNFFDPVSVDAMMFDA